MKFGGGAVCRRSVCRPGTVTPPVLFRDESGMFVSPRRWNDFDSRFNSLFPNKVSFLSPWVEISEFAARGIRPRPRPCG